MVHHKKSNNTQKKAVMKKVKDKNSCKHTENS